MKRLTKAEAEDLVLVMFAGASSEESLEAWHRAQARWYPEMGDNKGTPIYSVVSHVLRAVAT